MNFYNRSINREEPFTFVLLVVNKDNEVVHKTESSTRLDIKDAVERIGHYEKVNDDYYETV